MQPLSGQPQEEGLAGLVAELVTGWGFLVQGLALQVVLGTEMVGVMGLGRLLGWQGSLEVRGTETQGVQAQKETPVEAGLEKEMGWQDWGWDWGWGWGWG